MNLLTHEPQCRHVAYFHFGVIFTVKHLTFIVVMHMWFNSDKHERRNWLLLRKNRALLFVF